MASLPDPWLALTGTHIAERPLARRVLAVVAAILALVSVVVTLCLALSDWNRPEVPWLERMLGAIVGPLLAPLGT